MKTENSIDIVITWVDGNDPEWRSEKNKTRYMGRLKKLKKIRIHREGTHTLAGSLLLILAVNVSGIGRI